MHQLTNIDPLIALGVVIATMLSDAVCVLHTSSVAHRQDLAAANWGALTYMLSAVAVIGFTSNWAYVFFAALGSWIGAYGTMKFLRWRSARAAAATALHSRPDSSVMPAFDEAVACPPTPMPASPDRRFAA